MQKLIHDYISVTLFIIALLIGAYSMIVENTLFGLLYLGYIGLFFVLTAAIYCRSCPHTYNKTCKHYFIGRIAGLMPKPKNSPTTINVIAELFMVAILMAVPQYWLFVKIELFITFWILACIAGTEIFLFVCKTCENTNCPNCKYHSSISSPS